MWYPPCFFNIPILKTRDILLNGLKVGGAVFAQGTYDVVREGITLVDPAADPTDITLFALRLGTGLHFILIVGVGHGFAAGGNSCFGDGADEHTVGVKIHIVLHL